MVLGGKGASDLSTRDTSATRRERMGIGAVHGKHSHDGYFG